MYCRRNPASRYILAGKRLGSSVLRLRIMRLRSPHPSSCSPARIGAVGPRSPRRARQRDRLRREQTDQGGDDCRRKCRHRSVLHRDDGREGPVYVHRLAVAWHHLAAPAHSPSAQHADRAGYKHPSRSRENPARQTAACLNVRPRSVERARERDQPASAADEAIAPIADHGKSAGAQHDQPADQRAMGRRITTPRSRHGDLPRPIPAPAKSLTPADA